MKRCKHPTIEVLEMASAGTYHYWDNGGWIGHETAMGEYTGRIEVRCMTCGLFVAGTMRTLPHWAVARLWEVLNP